MFNFPKVSKKIAGAVSGHKRVKKILGSFVVAAGVTSTVAISGADTAKASVSPDTGLSNSAQGALVFVPADQNGDLIAYHMSHRSHYAHQSHRSHYSHYSSRY